MKYPHIVTATFLERPNRFIAHAMVQGQQVVCHVKNTGRCKELLIPGVQLVLEYHPDARALGRKTSYSVIGVYKEQGPGGQPLYINMDSQAPNQVAWEWLCTQAGVSQIRREVTFLSSRLDLAYVRDGRPGFIEVKGVTLEQNGIAMFPDAPTQRGIKHLMELKTARAQGYEAAVLFVIQMKGVTAFTPNMTTHPAFGNALTEIKKAGVEILAYDCLSTPQSLQLDAPVPVLLPKA